MNATYLARKEAGLCPVCGGTRDSAYICCAECRRKSREGKDKRVAEGLCRTCGAPRTDHPYLCPRCLVIEHGVAVRERQTPAPDRSVQQPTQRHLRARSPARLRAEVFGHYGGKCVCCGIDNYAFLQVDHINGGGDQHRRELNVHGRGFYRWIVDNNFPANLQLLCANCHQARHRFGECKHPATWQPVYTVQTPRVNDFVAYMNPRLADVEPKDPLATSKDPLTWALDPMAGYSEH